MAFRCLTGLAIAFFLANSDPSGAVSGSTSATGGDLPVEDDSHLEDVLESPYEIRFEGGA